MALPNPAPGDSVAADDIDQIRNHLTGQSGKTEAWHLRQSSGNALITLATADGSNGFRINDSGGVEMFYVDSDGNVTVVGTMTQSGGLVIPTSATPSQTTDGQVVWDSDDDVLTIGDGSSRKTFYPGRAARQEILRGVYSPAATAATTALTANTAYLVPIEPLTQDVTVTGIVVNLGGSTDNLDVGIYSTTDGATFTKVVSLGSTAFPGTGRQVLNIADTALSVGTRYYYAFGAAGTTLTIAAQTNVSNMVTINYAVKATSFPLPSSLTGMSTALIGPYMIGVLSGGGVS